MKTAKSIFQSAQDNWPEDEALAVSESFTNAQADYPEDGIRNTETLRKDCARMERFFASEADCAELVRRFRAEIFRITGVIIS